MSRLLSLYQQAEKDNIQVDCFDMKKREAFSMMDEEGNCYVAIDPFQLTSNRDETLKLAHELGHCYTGSFYNRYTACDVRQKHENRADKWAIQYLIPKGEFEEAIASGITEIWDLAEHFDVSEDFMRKVVCWYTHNNLSTELYF